MNKTLGVLGMAVFAAGMARATVVDFDDLIGQAAVPEGYGGITWSNNWMHYDFAQDPFNPSSGLVRIYTNYSLHPAFNLEEVSFSFATPTSFQGAYFSGRTYGVEFRLYDSANTLLATSANLVPTGTPTWLDSGYAGLVSRVGVYGRNGEYVLDDVTYTSVGAVPEPFTMALGAMGLGVAALRRRRK